MTKRMLITERFGTPIEYVYFVIFKKKFYIQKIFEGNYYLYREDKEPPETKDWKYILNPWFCSDPPISHSYRTLTKERMKYMIDMGYVDFSKSK